MTHWYWLAVFSLIVLGTQRFLYKVAAEQGCNTAITTFVFMATVAVMSWCVYLPRAASLVPSVPLLLVSLINSIGFLTTTLATIEALKNLASGTVYTLTRLSTALSIVFSLIYFGERLTLSQGLGVLLALVVIVIFARSRGETAAGSFYARRGFVLVGLAVLGGATSTVSSKFAAMHVDSFGFMALSYTSSALLVLLVKQGMLPTRAEQHLKPALVLGLAMGLANFIGYYALLQALARGPLAIIAPLAGMYFVVALLLSYLVYRDRLTRPQVLGVVLTMLSILLMR